MPSVDDDLPSGLTPEEFSARIFGAEGPGLDDGGARLGGEGLELAPFCGVRFAPEVVGDLARVTTPPYDLIDDDEVRRLMASDGHNVVRLILPRTRPGHDPDESYQEAGETLRRWLAEGALTADGEPSLYLYEATGANGGRALQRGLIGAIGLRAEADRVVLPHENVFPGPVRDRLALMAAARANLEPIFLVYEGGGEAARIIDEVAEGSAPVLEFHADDGLVHRLWRLADPGSHARIAEDLTGRRALIADGHHRYATYRALQARHHAAGDGPGPWDYGLAMLVDSTRYPPHLGAIHRVLPGLAPEVAMGCAKAVFQVTDLPGSLEEAMAALAAAERPAFLLGGGDQLHLLTEPNPALLAQTMPADHSERWRGLDTAVLDQVLIRGVWDIVEDEHSVEVVHDDPAAAIDRAQRTGGTAVVLKPLEVEDVLAVAEGGERVPRKSTSFGPKPRTGLVLRLLDLP